MTTCHEQIGQRAGYEQAMSVLLEPAITHLGEAEHPLDDTDRMFDPGPHFGAAMRGSQIVYCSPMTHGPFSSLRSISS